MKLCSSSSAWSLAANCAGFSRSCTRSARRAILSSYAGPMPRPVVPIFVSPIAASRAWSSATWIGSTSGHAGEIFRRERTSTPAASSSPISCSSAAGDSTTPLPTKIATPGRSTPDGMSRSTVFLPAIHSVWPALCPPWKRTTPAALSVSQSTILPLPSSPHWVPMTTTFLPISSPRRATVRHRGRACAHCRWSRRATRRRRILRAPAARRWPARALDPRRPAPR